MASERKLYMVMRDLATGPNTNIRLGDIIMYPTDPEYTRVTREKEEFPHFQKSHDDGGALNSDIPTISKETAIPWTGYAKKHSSADGTATVEVLNPQTHQEYTKLFLSKYACDELETQVLNIAQKYVRKRVAAVAVREVMKLWGELLGLKSVCHHRKYLFRISIFFVALGVSHRTSRSDLTLSFRFPPLSKLVLQLLV